MKQHASRLLALALLLPATPLLAEQKMDGMKDMDMATKLRSRAAMTHTASGTVKKVDAKAGVVTVSHEPVMALNWPAMTMDFTVDETMLLDKLSVGKKVEFQFMKTDKGYVITGVK